MEQSHAYWEPRPDRWPEAKHGFEAALLDDGFDRLIAVIGEPGSLKDITERLIKALNAMPWLPILITRSVYFSEELRTHFMARHAPRLVGALRKAAPRKKGIDPAFAALSILSMLMFPQIARPVVGKVFGVNFDDAFARAFSAHIETMFS